jgi:FkbM family methyltransferase
MLEKMFRNVLVRKAYGAASRIPLVGPGLRKIVKSVVPPGTRVWTTIAGGSGRGLMVNLDSRYEDGYARGGHEPLVEKMLTSHLRPGFVVYDVGAHIGILALIAARVVGREGEVIAFEADQGNAERITEHARRNSMPQIEVVENAVWRTNGSLRFERASSQSSRNQGAVVSGTTKDGSETIEVQSVSLDEFARTHRPPNVIKVDVEGAEYAVLEGGDRLFSSVKPLLICEVHNGEACLDVTQWLSKREYSYVWLESSEKFPRHLLAKPNIS